MKQLLKFTVYRDLNGEFRWKATRGSDLVACCGEGYVTLFNCKRALTAFLKAVKGTVEVIYE